MCIDFLTLFFSFLKMRPSMIASQTNWSSSFIFNFLILSSLRSIEFYQIFSVGKKRQFDVFNFLLCGDELLPTGFILILKDFEFFDDLS